jgi:RTX calcium-binding nonapeptide repeat (4 copies)
MGNDRLVGRGGDDVLEGLDGAVGSEYDDSVDAGEGNDIFAQWTPMTNSSPARPTEHNARPTRPGGVSLATHRSSFQELVALLLLAF